MLRKLAALAFAPILLLGACSDDGGGGGQAVEAVDAEAALAALRAAPDAAAAAGSGRMEMVMAVQTPEGDMEITGRGVFSGTQMHMEMDLGSALAGQLGAGDELPEGLDEPMEIVVDGTTTYMRFPFLSALTGSTGWLSLSPEDVGLAGESLGMGMGATSNPAQMLETLRGVSNEFEDLGTDEVRGASTRRYRVVIDLAKVAAELPEEQKALYEQQLEALGSGTMPADVWLDADGLVRRIELDLSEVLGDVEGQDLGTGTVTMEFFDYGQDVEVEVPDEAEVTPFVEALGALGALG